MNGWVEANDRLPADAGPVWIWNGEQVRVAVWHAWMRSFPECLKVTHWQALAAPEKPWAPRPTP